MKKRMMLAVVAAFALAGGSASGAERATKADAEKMVKKGVQMLKTDGKDKAAAEMTAPSQTFVDRDLYLVIYDMQGNCVAHGQNPKQVGKPLIGLKDPDGKLFVKERVELAKAQGKFWQDYKFTDPITKKVLPKQMYCERSDELVVCGGIYKS